MLYTNLKHLETAHEYLKIIEENASAVIICGRMDAKSVLLYNAAEELEREFRQVLFFDMEFDNPESEVLQVLNPDKYNAVNPFVVFCKDGKVAGVVPGGQTKDVFIHHIMEQLLFTEKK